MQLFIYIALYPLHLIARLIPLAKTQCKTRLGFEVELMHEIAFLFFKFKRLYFHVKQCNTEKTLADKRLPSLSNGAYHLPIIIPREENDRP